MGNIHLEFIMFKPSLKTFSWKTYREYVTWKGNRKCQDNIKKDLSEIKFEVVG
jgi:hypothetical protein